MTGEYTAAEVAAAVGLAVVSAEGWHSIAITFVRRKLGVEK